MEQYLTFTHRDLITQWFNHSQEMKHFVPSVFDQFIYLWFSFNAWASFCANTYVDKNMIKWFASCQEARDNYSNLLSSDSAFRSHVNRLTHYEVLDMRFPLNKGKKLEDICNFDKLVEIIYQIRCNLFHGKKSLEDPHDSELVELAYQILTKLFKPFVDGLEKKTS